MSPAGLPNGEVKEELARGQNDGRVLMSIIVPTWNGRALLGLPLDSLRRQKHRDLEVIVVDDASTDDTAAWVETTYPEVRLVRLARNQGFAAAVNAGIRAARGEAIVLLNNDAEADPGWLEALAAALDAHPDAGMIASRVYLYHHRDRLDSAGIYASTGGMVGNRGAYQPSAPDHETRRLVLGPSGAAAVYRRALIDDVGLLDESLIAYFEDVDLAIRAQLRGWKCLYEPRAICWHVGSATYAARDGGAAPVLGPPPPTPRTVFLGARNYPVIAVKFLPWRVLLRDGWALLAYELNFIRFALAHRMLAQYVSARASLLRVLPAWVRQRRRLQRTRKISTREVVALFERPRLADYLGRAWRRLTAKGARA